MSFNSGADSGSHSTVSQCARAASAARESLLVWIGPLSSTSVTGLMGCARDGISVAAGDDVQDPLPVHSRSSRMA